MYINKMKRFKVKICVVTFVVAFILGSAVAAYGLTSTVSAGENEPAVTETETGTDDLFPESEEENEETFRESEEETEEETERVVRLVCVGDNLMHREVSLSGLQQDGTFNYDYNFSLVKPYVESADIAIINQECVTAGNEWGIRDYPCFNARTEVIDAIENAGFDVVLAATNHILDMGAGGPVYMLRYFQSNHPDLMLLGIHDCWENRDQICVKEVNGIRIGMINYTDILNNTVDYRGNEYLVDYLDPWTPDFERLEHLIQETKKESDFVIVFPHWGTEYNLGIDDQQARETAFLAEQGVDLVLGAHPHVVEPVTVVERPDGGKMLVYYSLGNFQSYQNREARLLGGMAQVEIVMDGNGARIRDFDMEFLMTDYRFSGRGTGEFFDLITTYPWESYSRDIAVSGGIGMRIPDFSADRIFQLQAGMAVQVKKARADAGITY